MTDAFTKEKRSEVMRAIRSKGTGLEKDTARMLRRAHIKYRSHPKAFGTPDFLVEAACSSSATARSGTGGIGRS